MNRSCLVLVVMSNCCSCAHGKICDTSLTAANLVSFDFNVSYSSCWGYSLINTLKSNFFFDSAKLSHWLEVPASITHTLEWLVQMNQRDDPDEDNEVLLLWQKKHFGEYSNLKYCRNSFTSISARSQMVWPSWRERETMLFIGKPTGRSIMISSDEKDFEFKDSRSNVALQKVWFSWFCYGIWHNSSICDFTLVYTLHLYQLFTSAKYARVLGPNIIHTQRLNTNQHVVAKCDRRFKMLLLLVLKRELKKNWSRLYLKSLVRHKHTNHFPTSEHHACPTEAKETKRMVEVEEAEKAGEGALEENF